MNRKVKISSVDEKKEPLKPKKRIKKYIRETPAEYSSHLSLSGKCHVNLKLNNFQLTGSFKLRVAINKLLSLSKKDEEKGIIPASSGYHGIAVAYGLNMLSNKRAIFLPETSQAKKLALRNYDAGVKLQGNDGVKAEAFDKETAEKHNQIFISPYNNPKIISGQATIGMELAKRLKNELG